MTVNYCGDGFCGPQKKNIDSACHDLGKEAGKWIMYQNGGTTCYCICSCMGEGTLVTTGNGSQIKVEDMVEGQTTVLAAGKDLRFSAQVAESVVSTSSGETKNTVYLKYEMNGKTVERVVTMDHPFLLSNKTLVGAGALQLNDELLDQNGNRVSIKEIKWGSYIGKFWEFAVSMNKPDSNYTNHLVVTEGVVTGDFAISVYENYPVSSEETSLKGSPNRPFVGSAEWKELNRKDPGDAQFGAIQFEHGIFVPANSHEVEIPEHASAFLPENQAILLEEFAPKEPVSNPNLLDMCEYLIEFVFEPHYPDIKFLFNWYDDRVNSYSWIDGISGEQIIYLSGGLARIEGFHIEGVTMALAHEVGHIMGKPKLENGLTCEGQADWFAGAVVMRAVWFGEEYFVKTKKAIQQLRTLYSYIDEHDEEEAGAPEEDIYGQPYPSNACRLNTYKTAMSSPVAPACSLCDVEEGEYEDEDLCVADGLELFLDNDGFDDDDDYEDEDEDDFDDEEDDFDDEVTAKAPGARDRQRRKKRSLESEVQAKSPGARDRQRRKKRAMGAFEDDVAAKAPGARDRQRRKKRLADEGDELLAKAPGARDRQRRKKRALEGFGAEVTAKAPGARDRQRRKKSRLADEADASMAKITGARDRQRKKKNRFDEAVLEALDVAAARPGKGDGANDRQRKKKRRISGKVAGARDRQRKKKQ